MITRTPQNIIICISSPMFKLFTLSLTILAIIITGDARELRPSEHGLPYQDLSAKSPEMMLFFGEVSPPAKNPATPVMSNETASLDTWWRESPGRKEDTKLKKALLIATVVCGVTGVVLLLAAAFLFALYFYRRRLALSSSSLGGADSNAANNVSVSAATVSSHK